MGSPKVTIGSKTCLWGSLHSRESTSHQKGGGAFHKEKKGSWGPRGRAQGQVTAGQPHLGRCSAQKCQAVSPLKFQGLQEALDSLFPSGREFVQACPSELGIPTGLEPFSKQLLCHCSLVFLQLVPLPLLSIHVSGLLQEKSRVWGREIILGIGGDGNGESGGRVQSGQVHKLWRVSGRANGV